MTPYTDAKMRTLCGRQEVTTIIRAECQHRRVSLETYTEGDKEAARSVAVQANDCLEYVQNEDWIFVENVETDGFVMADSHSHYSII